MSDKWEQMRQELMGKTGKELRAIAKRERISLGYDAARKDTMASAIVTWRRHREASADE